MIPPIKYKDHISHYKKDAEFNDYFEINAFEEQNIRRRYEQFFGLLNINSPCRLLEIGSGGGYALKLIDPQLIRYFPLDIPHPNLQKLKQQACSPIFPTSGDIFNLPFRAQSFDVIVLSEVLEHLDLPEEALKEVYRVLDDHGKLIISVPYREVITYQICVHCNQPTPTHAHFHSFNEINLQKLIREAGFDPQVLLKINNKIAARLSIYRILFWTPFRIWRFLDQVFNFIVPKPSHLICFAHKVTIS